MSPVLTLLEALLPRRNLGPHPHFQEEPHNPLLTRDIVLAALILPAEMLTDLY